MGGDGEEIGGDYGVGIGARNSSRGAIVKMRIWEDERHFKLCLSIIKGVWFTVLYYYRLTLFTVWIGLSWTGLGAGILLLAFWLCLFFCFVFLGLDW